MFGKASGISKFLVFVSAVRPGSAMSVASPAVPFLGTAQNASPQVVTQAERHSG